MRAERFKQILKNGVYRTIGETAVARVDRVGMCERGWLVDGGGDLAEEDMLLIGLVYHTILQRQQQQQQAGGAAAGT